MQRESGRRLIALVPVYFRNGSRITAFVGLEKILGLLAQLFEVRLLREPAEGQQ
jgi:hypothetical protein